MKVLVTGAAGFVGINSVKRLAERGAKVVALTRQQPNAAIERFLREVRAHVTFAQGDVRNRAGLTALCQREGIERVLHSAAMTPTLDVERAEPATVVDSNLGGTLNVLGAARVCGMKRVVFVSSSGVYGAPHTPSEIIHEERPLCITGLYSICKQASEQLCRRYAELFGMSAASGRLGSAYGPMERGTGSRQNMSAVYVLSHAALKGERSKICGADFLRDFCHIDDVADAFAGLMLADTLSWDVYNVCAGTAHTLRETCETLHAIEPRFSWTTTDDANAADLAVRPPSERGIMDIARLRQDIGFAPRYDLKTGLRSYLDWLREFENM